MSNQFINFLGAPMSLGQTLHLWTVWAIQMVPIFMLQIVTTPHKSSENSQIQKQ
jgi:hypothetical protein